jgi:23S rRNA pseudouridine2605 synthase
MEFQLITIEPSDQQPEAIRLQKVLARLGFGSRRVCDDMIAEGRIRVDGEIAELGRRIDPANAKVMVDDVPIGVAPELIYYLLNKPIGVITSMSDPQGRPTVADLVPSSPQVHNVGRLDEQTSGLLIMTNDGDLTQRLTHPSYGVEKEYIAHLDRDLAPLDLRMLREGIELDDGLTSPAKVARIDDRVVRIAIHEGRNRQVRRMFAARGAQVERLVRCRIGPITDRRLAPGAWRNLDQGEVRELEIAHHEAVDDTV